MFQAACEVLDIIRIIHYPLDAREQLLLCVFQR